MILILITIIRDCELAEWINMCFSHSAFLPEMEHVVEIGRLVGCIQPSLPQS